MPAQSQQGGTAHAADLPRQLARRGRARERRRAHAAAALVADVFPHTSTVAAPFRVACRLTKPTSPPTFHYFFDLPAELREQILLYLCGSPEGYVVGANLAFDERAPTSPSTTSGSGSATGDDSGAAALNPRPAVAPLSLFLAGAQLHREAAALWYGRNVFHLNLAGGGKRWLAPLLDDNTGLLGGGLATRRARLGIRRAVVHLRRVGGHYARVVGPALDDMVLAGSLRDLEVRFLCSAPPCCRQRIDGGGPVGSSTASSSSTSGGGGGDGDGNSDGHQQLDGSGGLRNSPFQALLRLLADPYLERVAVRVEPRRHWSMWCPFHAGDHRDTDGSTWTDIDVGALLQAYGQRGGEWNILSIGS